MARKIIIAADDYAACDFIDRGIERAIAESKLTTVNVFVTFPDSESRIRKLVQIQQELRDPQKFGIGLHFSLTAGSPVAGIHNSLTSLRDGRPSLRDPKKYPFSKVKRAEVNAELRAQIEKLSVILGGIDQIDYLSNHHGIVYLDNRFFEEFIDVAEEYSIPIRSPMSWFKSILQPKIFERRRRLPPLIREGIGLGFGKQYLDLSVQNIKDKVRLSREKNLYFPYCSNDCFYGVANIVNLNKMLETYSQFSTICTEFMFHLGHWESDFPESNLADLAPPGINHLYFVKRKEELASLLEMDIENLQNQFELQLIRFRDLLQDDVLQPS